MLVNAGESYPIYFCNPAACVQLFPHACFSFSSQKHSLPWLLQVAQEHHQQIPHLLLSAQPNHTVLHRDLH